MNEPNQINAADVERRIEQAGREAVFAKARELGWRDGGAPLWVWNQICLDINSIAASQSQPGPTVSS